MSVGPRPEAARAIDARASTRSRAPERTRRAIERRAQVVGRSTAPQALRAF